MMIECKFMEAKCRDEEGDFEVMAGNESQCEWKFQICWRRFMGSIFKRFGSCGSIGAKHGSFGHLLG